MKTFLLRQNPDLEKELQQQESSGNMVCKANCYLFCEEGQNESKGQILVERFRGNYSSDPTRSVAPFLKYLSRIYTIYYALLCIDIAGLSKKGRSS